MDAKELPPRASLEQYKKQAKDLLDACRSGDRDAVRRIHECPRLSKPSGAGAGRTAYALADAQFVIAREHGFESWPKFSRHVRGLRRGPVLRFESAVDAVVDGDASALDSLLRASPGLARARSTRAHRATLLHYLSANGVEDFRQKTPGNAVTIAELLLEGGAEVDAVAHAYGGESTTMELLVSSVHPAAAGVQVALVETLLDFGAAVDGVGDDGSPLMTALAFRYPDAADALARRGARVDNVLAAAGLGREDLVRSFVGADGRLRRDVPLATVRWPRLAKDPKVHMELALIWAAALGHVGVVDFLAQQRVDLAAKDDQGFTALHWAAFQGQLDVVDALLRRNAPLEAKNKYGGTVLDATVWASAHVRGVFRAGGVASVDYVPVVERLIAAGARVDAVASFPSGNGRVDDVLERHGACAPT